MKKKIRFIATTLFIAGSTSAYAQLQMQDCRKWDAQTEVLLQGLNNGKSSRSTTSEQTESFIIGAEDVNAVADSIRAAGGRATIISSETLTATLPLSSLNNIFSLEGIKRIRRSVKAVPYMETARQQTMADLVHKGEGLETPFTGKGVIVGIIDVGFQYKHPAFNDNKGNTRVIATWNRMVKDEQPVSGIPSSNSDGDSETGGHATHVTGIAAGSRIAGNNFHGMAPEADIIMVPSTLESAEILEDMQWIKQVADSLGRPFVVNMSFGSNYGPHDGTDDFDIAADNFLGSGALIAAAMGNDGGTKSHVSYDYSDTTTEKIVMMDNTAYGELLEYNVVDLWGTIADGRHHLNITPIYYNAITKTITELTKPQINGAINYYYSINKNNKKENFYCEVSLPTLAALSGSAAFRDKIYFGLKISAADAGAGFHAWVMPNYGEFVSKTTNGLIGNDKYLVGQAAASIPRSIGVASFNGAASWVSAYNGAAYAFSSNTISGQMSDFSSPGPSLGSDMKPTVAAPGATITSAYNKYAGLQLDDVLVVGAVQKDGTAVESYTSIKAFAKNNYDYYGVMSGTSMATPAASGILALWLQACPSLTPEQAEQIIKETATRDAYTSTTAEWTEKAGYGKINAYEGLKKALQLNLASGITSQTMSNDNPFSFKKEAGEWRILHNTAENGITLSIHSIDGRTVEQRCIDAVNPGDETRIGLSHLPAGIYVLRVATPHAVASRKIVINH